MKKPWKFFIYIIINFGCGEKIAVEDNEAIYTNVEAAFDESNKISENLTTFNYEITHFNDTHAEVRNLFER